MAEQGYGRPVAASQGGTANLADVLERVLDKGIVIAGDIKLLLADIEVLTLQIRLVVCSVDKAKEVGLDWWTNNPAFSGKAAKKSASEKLSSDQLEERLRRLEEAIAPESDVE